MVSILQRFKIIVQPDLSDASIHVINMTETIPDDFMKSLDWEVICEGYRVREDALSTFGIIVRRGEHMLV